MFPHSIFVPFSKISECSRQRQQSSKHPTFSDGQSRACLNEPAVSTYKWFARIGSSMSSQGKTRQTKNLNDRSFTNELGAGAEFAAPVGEASDPLGTKWQWYWVWDNRHWQREPWGMMGNITAQEGKPNDSSKLPVFLEFFTSWLIHHKSILTCSVCALVPSASLSDAFWILTVTSGHACKPVTLIAS